MRGAVERSGTPSPDKDLQVGAGKTAPLKRKDDSASSPHPERRWRVHGCRTCIETPPGALMPPHDASSRCESGKHSHCTCDTCF